MPHNIKLLDQGQIEAAVFLRNESKTSFSLYFFKQDLKMTYPSV